MRVIAEKLDELILAIEKAHNTMINIETLSDEELAKLEERFRYLKAHSFPAEESSTRYRNV